MDPFLRFLRKASVSYRALFGFLSPKTYLLIMVINPVIQLSFFALLARHVYGAEDLSPWIIGNSLVLMYLNALFGIAPQLSSERNMGTLKHLIASPTGSPGIFLPRAFCHMLNGILTVTIGLAAGFLLFDFSIPPGRLIAFYTVVICASVSVMGLGLFISSFGLLTRDLNLVMNLTSSLLLIGTGANIPLDALPAPAVKLSCILPLTRSIEAAGLIRLGGELGSVAELMAGELGLGMVYFTSGYLSFFLIERAARKKASIDLY